jgi:hypothetical protein
MSVRTKLLLAVAIISLAALAGYLASVADSAARLEPPPLALKSKH